MKAPLQGNNNYYLQSALRAETNKNRVLLQSSDCSRSKIKKQRITSNIDVQKHTVLSSKTL